MESSWVSICVRVACGEERERDAIMVEGSRPSIQILKGPYEDSVELGSMKHGYFETL